ncbi:MAG: formylglycine-generating enzyme family protein, partial [Kiritimatiellae bacterium]|nr:formylglycine-generating enzyme family protein [Kiritimatiellia bacterium]
LAGRRKEDPGAKAVSPDGRQPGEKLAFELKAGVEVKFVWCPPGMFFMGSPEEEAGREDVERRHSVFLTKGFWIGYAPVTQMQWMIIMGSNPSAFDLGTDYPVESVSWNDCQEFIRRLNSGTHGLGTFSLPTEAQWEYACRAGTEAPFATETLAEMAWFADNSDEKTHPVAAKKPNAWGIYDMHGNVCEWCQDVFLEDYPPEEMDPAGPPDKVPGEHPHVLRGGAWCYPADVCRSAARRSNSPDFAAQILGLRLVFNPASQDRAGGPKFRRKAQ